MKKAFPPLPPGLKEWFAIHEMIEQHGRDGFKDWLGGLKEDTRAFQSAVSAYADVEYFEQMRDKADELMAVAESEAEAVRAKAEAKAQTMEEVLSKRVKAFELKAKEWDEQRKQEREDLDTLDEGLKASTASLAERADRLAADEARVKAEAQRLSEKEAELTTKLAAFKEAQALLK